MLTPLLQVGKRHLTHVGNMHRYGYMAMSVPAIYWFKNGQLSAVIDFGQLAVGDPACDLVIAWTLFSGESRVAFCDILSLGADTWVRAKGWALWKALITAAGFTNPNNFEAQRCWCIIDEILYGKKP